METEFRHGKFEEGAIAGIHKVGTHLTAYYPQVGGNKANELPDQPILI